jgi:hypothetical protein
VSGTEEWNTQGKIHNLFSARLPSKSARWNGRSSPRRASPRSEAERTTKSMPSKSARRSRRPSNRQASLRCEADNQVPAKWAPEEGTPTRRSWPCKLKRDASSLGHVRAKRAVHRVVAIKARTVRPHIRTQTRHHYWWGQSNPVVG